MAAESRDFFSSTEYHFAKKPGSGVIFETKWYDGGSEGSKERATRGWQAREREGERGRQPSLGGGQGSRILFTERNAVGGGSNESVAYRFLLLMNSS